MSSRILLFCLGFLSVFLPGGGAAPNSTFPPPFSRPLSVGENGDDVLLLQHFLARDPAVSVELDFDGEFGYLTADALGEFQKVHSVPCKSAGTLDVATADLVMSLNTTTCDGYRDNGKPASAYKLKYKIIVHLHRNRSIEDHNAVLLDENNTLLHTFTARAHGHDAVDNGPWPDYNSLDAGLNQYSHDGSTVTGLALADLNSPEPDPGLYGPYPINRLVRGLEGNAQWLLPELRNGILLHTGNWSAASEEKGYMPNSAGCIHTHGEDVQTIWQKLVNLGVQVRNNPGGVVPYPFAPQGLISVMQLDTSRGCL